MEPARRQSTFAFRVAADWTSCSIPHPIVRLVGRLWQNSQRGMWRGYICSGLLRSENASFSRHCVSWLSERGPTRCHAHFATAIAGGNKTATLGAGEGLPVDANRGVVFATRMGSPCSSASAWPTKCATTRADPAHTFPCFSQCRGEPHRSHSQPYRLDPDMPFAETWRRLRQMVGDYERLYG